MGGPFIPYYEWTRGPNILGALEPGVQVSGGGGGGGGGPTILRHRVDASLRSELVVYPDYYYPKGN